MVRVLSFNYILKLETEYGWVGDAIIHTKVETNSSFIWDTFYISIHYLWPLSFEPKTFGLLFGELMFCFSNL